MRIRLKNIGKSHWMGELIKPYTSDDRLICEYAIEEALKHLPAKIPELKYDAKNKFGELFIDGKNVGNFWVVK
jgi:hypothetical protein